MDAGDGQGHRADHRLGAVGLEGGTLHLLHHPTGAMRDVARLGRAGRPADAGRVAATTSSRRPGVRVDRVGDCVAPRRAHAAVIEGERVGAAL